MIKRFFEKTDRLMWPVIWVLSVGFTVYYPFAIGEVMNMADYVLLGVVATVHAVVMLLFYLTQGRWSVTLYERAAAAGTDDAKLLINSAESAFWAAASFIFHIVLPYAFYIDQPMTKVAMLQAVGYAAGFQITFFNTPLYRVLFRDKAGSVWPVQVFFFICLFGVLAEAEHRFIPLGDTATVVALAGLYALTLPAATWLMARYNREKAAAVFDPGRIEGS